MDISEQKELARKAAFIRRKLAFQADDMAVERATEHLINHITAAAPKVIAAYMPIRTEIDTIPAMAALHTLGHTICVPVIVRAGLPLSFRAWTPDCEMAAGPFGAKIPVAGDWLAPDLLIVPLLAYNQQGYRLGYGGGFYDRSLQLLRAKRATHAVGFAFAAQEGDVPIEETDQQLDAVVTERGCVSFS